MLLLPKKVIVDLNRILGEIKEQIEHNLEMLFENYKSLDESLPLGMVEGFRPATGLPAPALAPAVKLYNLLYDILSLEAQLKLCKYFQAAAKKRARRHLLETDEYDAGNTECNLMDVVTYSTALTCNQMDFLKCSIAGVSYGMSSSEVEIAAAKQIASEASEKTDQNSSAPDLWENNGGDSGSLEIEVEGGITFSAEKAAKSKIKGFSFEDDSLMHGNWTKEPNSATIILFFRILALCQTAIPELNEETEVLTMRLNHLMKGLFWSRQGSLDLNFVRGLNQVSS